MADKTGIEWTDATWPIVQGCDYESPGCTHCYAVPLIWRLAHNPNLKISAPLQGLVEKRGDKLAWTGELALREDRLTWPIDWREPRMIFVPSHGDLFHPKVPNWFIDRAFAVMALTPRHTYQILTKRTERMRGYFSDPDRALYVTEQMMEIDPVTPFHNLCACDGTDGDGPWPLPNVWLGTSVEDQKRADERIPLLLQTPAAKKFLSIEPLLGPIDLTPEADFIYRTLSTWYGPDGFDETGSQPERKRHLGYFPRVDWVICGGESGPKARPMHPEWARSIRDQCTAAGVPFFFKQWGSHRVVYDRNRDDPDWRRCGEVDRETPNGRWLNSAGGHGFHGECVVRVVPARKGEAGRLLDGREWNQMPEAAT